MPARVAHLLLAAVVGAHDSPPGGTVADLKACADDSPPGGTVADLKAFYSRVTYPSQFADAADALRLTDFNSLAHGEHFGVRDDWALPTAEPLRILIAGCATGNDAVVLALQLQDGGDRGEVLCVDQSAPSLALAASLARKHNVSHLVRTLELDLHRLDAGVHGTFDYIVSSGVLHHQPSPELGLAALTAVLKPGGALGIMMHASHGMDAVMEVHKLLQRSTPAHLGWAERLETARTLQRALRDAVPPSLRHNLELNLASDEATADLYLVPHNRAYTVRQLAAWLTTSRVCVLRLEPAWRYDLEDVLTHDGHDPQPLAHVPRLSRLDRASLADAHFGVAINHRFIARVAVTERERIDGFCEDEAQEHGEDALGVVAAARRDPLSAALAPVWMAPVMAEAFPRMLAIGNRTERLHHALSLLMPGTFGHAMPDSIEGALRQTPDAIAAHIQRALDAFPEDASKLAELADGCTQLSDILAGAGRPDARDLRMYHTLERFFGLRLANVANTC